MVNEALKPAVDPERALALSYIVSGREAADALFALDNRLATILRRTGDPLVGQMRLTWWREALLGLDDAPPPAEPVLCALARDVLPNGISGVMLADIVEGWEVLLETHLDDAALLRYAVRGGALFEAVGVVIGAQGDPLELAGRGWALADLARHTTDASARGRAASLGRSMLDDALSRRWHRAGRALGAVAHLARSDLADPGAAIRVGTPRRIGRMLLHRLTGR